MNNNTISLEALSSVTGGTGNSSWDRIRTQAGEHCPTTAARFPNEPANRAEAEVMGAACLREMGPIKRGLGGTRAIRNGINEAFPR
jgi:hypothetical protein